MLTTRVGELGERLVSISAQCEEAEAKIETCQQEIETRSAELTKTEQGIEGISIELANALKEKTAGELALAELERQIEEDKAQALELMRRVAREHNEITALGVRQENLASQKQRITQRGQQISLALDEVRQSSASAATDRDAAAAEVSKFETDLEASNEASTTLAQNEQELQAQLAKDREERSSVLSRTRALAEMQNRLEGVGQGVKRVLKALGDGKVTSVKGMLADFIETDVEHATVVEAALAGADQLLLAENFEAVVAESPALIESLAGGASAEIICLDRLASSPGPSDTTARIASDDIIAYVSDWVRCENWLAPAVANMLGQTVVVADLASAQRTLAITASCRIVTLSGEVIEPDGRVRIGATNRSTGTIARRSELTQLEAKLKILDTSIEALSNKCESARSKLKWLADQQKQIRQNLFQANTRRVEFGSKVEQLASQATKLESEQPLIQADIERIDAEIAQSAEKQAKTRVVAADLENQANQASARISDQTSQVAQARVQRDVLAATMTEFKVSLASAEQKRAGSRDAIASLTRQQTQMADTLVSDRESIELNRARRTEAEQGAVAAREQIETIFNEQEKLNLDSADNEQSRQGLSDKLESIRMELTAQRKSSADAGETVNANRIEISENDVRIEALITRAAEDMQMNLAELFGEYEHDDSRDWDEVESEIDQLRTKIGRLGNVNLDAIGEQEELEQRSNFLATQLADIDSARKRLDDLINRINTESRELFLATFNSVRENFQQLFRKLFGGGKADIMLLDDEDVLECGIEIVAKPPGKELRNLSLLSGGEKTMTALSLLFSIFKSRPSPFCLLDEVDAALDEANTERFSRLVQEFVSLSQFIVISHAKRTMAMSNVLYGVTMQEPGVSTRISVKFEDSADTLDKQLEPVLA